MYILILINKHFSDAGSLFTLQSGVPSQTYLETIYSQVFVYEQYQVVLDISCVSLCERNWNCTSVLFMKNDHRCIGFNTILTNLDNPSTPNIQSYYTQTEPGINTF